MLRAIFETSLLRIAGRVRSVLRQPRLAKKLVVGLTVGALVLSDHGVADAFNPVRAYYRLARQQMRWERGTPFLDFLGQQLQNDGLLSLLQGLIARQNDDDLTTAQGPMTAQKPATDDPGLKSSYDRLVKSYETRYGTFTPAHPQVPGPNPVVPSTNRRIGLHIGLNELSSTAWPTAQRLNGCVNDAIAMKALADAAGFDETKTMINGEATYTRVEAEIKAAKDKLHAGDLFLLTLSSHGTFVSDKNGDEAKMTPGDLADEVWCLYDDGLLDDDVATLFATFEPGVRIVVVLDTCHSGTGTRVLESLTKVRRAISGPGVRGVPRGNVDVRPRLLTQDQLSRALAAKQVKFPSRELNNAPGGDGELPSVLLLSACQDNQQAADLNSNGLFTAALLSVWRRSGSSFKNYGELHDAVKQELILTDQTPNLFPIEPGNEALRLQPPFSAP